MMISKKARTKKIIITFEDCDCADDCSCEVDGKKCAACEMCVKRAGNSFEIVDKDGKLVATFTGKFSKDCIVSRNNCPNNAITIEYTK